ncbi:PspC domain-containing protein [Nocardia sp. GCM10030253]|uniref:PspC domain-containing protein n=1 Tax=Nocardia sp. GCM10030253 TaxID=3273404 RepID=UPI003638832D
MGNMTKTSFGDQLQQMWHTRPVRLPRQGPVAGVAAGFGQRYNVDPVLVRVALVVSTIFGGAGIVLYLLAWLLLNEDGDQASAAESLFGKGQSSQSQTKTIVLIVALAIAVSTMGPVGVGLAGSGLISMALMLSGWWMLHMRQPAPPPGTSMFGGLVTDGGITATGYPGTVFPPGSPLRTNTGDFFSPGAPPTNLYTPYTKLPDAYVPEAPVQHRSTQVEYDETATTPVQLSADDRAQHVNADTVLLDRADGDTVLLDKGDADTVLLDNGTESPHGTPSAGTNVPEASSDTDAVTPDANGSSSDSGTTPSLDKTTQSLDKGVSPSGTDRTSNSEAAAPTTDDPNSRPDESPSGTRTPKIVTPPLPTRTAGTPHTAFGGRTPPSWDPLGVAPLAWDLPEPTPTRTIVAPPPKRPRSRLTPMVLGLAILAAAGAGAAAASGVDWMTPGRIGAAALAVIGLGMVLGAFLRRGYGLLVVTAPLAGFVLLASMIGPIDFDTATMGERTWAPTSTSDLNPNYAVTMGTGTLDLRSLNLTENRSVEVSVQMGEAIVLLPAGMTARTECTVNAGDVNCPSGITGPNTPGAPVLDLKVNVRAGNVEVRRG